MEVLTLNGKKYVKASKAAKDLGYASDYVGQLCRSGAVDAHLVGRTWYVDLEMLGAHRVEKKRNARAKAREYARKTIEESRLHIRTDTKKNYENIGIRYQHDDTGLIPEVRKVHIASEKRIAPTETEPESEGAYTILNKDKKIIMSGPVPVYDVDAETPITDEVVLKPRIVKKRLDATTRIPQDAATEIQEIRIDPSVETVHHSSFAEKLSELDVHNEEYIEEEREIDMVPDSNSTAQPTTSGDTESVWIYRIVTWGSIILAIGACSTVLLEAHTVFSGGLTENSVVASFEDIFKILENI